MSWVQLVLASPIFWGFLALVLTLVLAAIAVSGKQSMKAATTLVILALIAALVWLVQSDLGLPSIPRWLVIVAAMCGLGVGAYYLIQWMERKAPQNQAQIERPTPHLQADLIIDSVKAEAIPFHVRITNIGDLNVTDLNIHQSATVVRSTGPPSAMLPLSKILPKGGHISNPGT
jgi:hypothetical protein